MTAKPANTVLPVDQIHEMELAVSGGDVCRVCHCSEPDKRGETALKYLDIYVPPHAIHHHSTTQKCGLVATDGKNESYTLQDPETTNEESNSKTLQDSAASDGKEVQGHLDRHSSKVVSEAGPIDSLMELGCSCRNDLALTHYACALRWFVNRGSMICEICGAPAMNVSIVDRNKILCILKDKNVSQQSQHVVAVVEAGDGYSTNEHNITCTIPHDSEQFVQIAAWFDPVGHTTSGMAWNFNEDMDNIPDEGPVNSVSPATKWVVEGTGMLIATGLLTVTISCLLSPRVDKGAARRGLNVLLGGLCALSIVVFLRFGILPRIKYGPARYWSILVMFWFLVFGVWASTTRNSRSNT